MSMNPRLLRPTASGFSPRSISGLALWLDAGDASSITAVSGAVSEWRDKTGTKTVLQGTPANRPTLVSNVFGSRPAVRFDGVNDFLDSTVPAPDLPWPSSMFAVVRKPTTQADGCIFAVNINGSNPFSNANSYIITTNSNSAAIRVLGGSSSVIFPGVGGTDDTLGSFLLSLTMATENNAVLRNVTAGQIATDATYTTNAPSVNNGFSLGIFKNLAGSSLHHLAGDIAEVLIFSGVLSTSEQERVQGYLAWRYGLQAGLPSNHPYAYSFPGFGSQARPSNADAVAWESAVYANSGSTSVGTLSAVDTFCGAIASAGIRDRFFRLNLFCGSFQGAFVPLFRGPSLGGTQYGGATDLNLGSPSFLVGDYNETGVNGGLLGNGSSKHLNTGFNVDQLPGAANCHLSSFITGTQDIASPRTLIGTLFNGVTDRYRLFLQLSGSSAPNYGIQTELGKANSAIANNRTNTNGGLILSSRTSTTLLTLYDDVVSIATNEVSTAETTGASPFFVFARNGPVEFYNGRMAAYSIGAGMTAAQVSDYNTAMQAFQTAMTRNV